MASLTMSMLSVPRMPCRFASAPRPMRQQRRTTCMAAPDTLKAAIAEAESLAKESKQARVAADELIKKSQAAWEQVEAMKEAAGNAPSTSEDPLDVYCGENPDADECRVYED